jgi:two-component system sensor histidine kinase KdpD
MRVLLAEDDPVVGDSLEHALRAAHHSVRRSVGVQDTVGLVGDGVAEVVLLDIQLDDGSAWDVLDRIAVPHPPFRVSLISATDLAPPLRWSYIPAFRKPLDHDTLQTAVGEAVPFEGSDADPGLANRPAAPWLERLLLHDAPSKAVSIPVTLAAVALVTLLMIPVREEAFGAISAAYTIVVLLLAAYSGPAVGLIAALTAFVAYDWFMVPPYYTLRIASTALVLDLLAFLAASVIGTVLIAAGRSLARGRASDAALSRLRLRLTTETMDVPSEQLLDTLTRVVGRSLPEGSEVALITGEDGFPPWVPEEMADLARIERRTVETRSANRAVLLLPVDAEGLLLAAAAPGSRFTDQDRRSLGYAATELAHTSERLDLLQVAESAHRLRARDEAKNALLAAVGHDLRTPLASMKAAVSAVLAPDVELSASAERGLLEIVDGEVDRLDEMIDHLLDLSRLESGVFRMKRDPVDLARLTLDAADRVRLSSGREVLVHSTGDATVTGDPVRLLEVVTNLIDNAARYSTPETPIQATVRPDAGSVTVSISDQGPGMDRDEQEKLFLPFVRGARSGPGSGLGLAITRSIVTAHQGQIDVVSAPGTGTTMSVTIPRNPLDG